ncbi:MAG: D-glycerate dehydrogenase [Rhodospirillales bacterium]
MAQGLVITRPMPDAVLARARADYAVTPNQDDADWARNDLPGRAAGAAAILTAPGAALTAEIIAALPESVKIAATFSVGYDHIDLEAAGRRGLIVTNTPDVLTDATADIALLCMLGAARRAWEGQDLLRRGAWTGWTPVQLMGTHLGGRRLGILGMGRIGRAVADRARAFGMTIHYHNRSRLAAEQEAGAIFHADPEELLKVSDVLSLNAPATAETENFLDAARIALLPQGAIVVNSARGNLVDDEALIAALRSGRLAAAGLDVFRGEPAVHPDYLSLTNAYLLPHMGSATLDTRHAMGFRCLDNLDAYFAGREPPNRIA